MNVQDFIKQLYIKEIGEIKNEHPYMAYMVIGAGIEFLGKVLEQTSRNDWFAEHHSSVDFKKAVSDLQGLKKYEKIKDVLYTHLRCGLLHSSVPKADLKLGDKNAEEEISTPPYILNIDAFYEAFKNACNDVILKINDKSITITDDFLDIEQRAIQTPLPQQLKNDNSESEPSASTVTTSLSGCSI